MAGELRYGQGGGGVEREIQQMSRASAASDELNRKEEARRGAEERTAGTEQGNARARSELATSTEQLSQALRGNLEALSAETEVLKVNTELLREQAGLRARMAGTPVIAAGGGFEEDPGAASRLASARSQMEAAIVAQERARADVIAARRSGAPPEQIAPLVASRGQANQAAAVARRDLQAAESNAAASEAAARAKQQQLQQEEADLAAITAKRRADEAAAATTAQQVRVLEESVARARATMLGVPTLSAGARGALAGQASQAALLYGRPATPASDTLRAAGFGAGIGTLPHAPGYTQDWRAETEGVKEYRQALVANAAEIEALGAKQAESNILFQQSAAIYADSSNALSRHGALTTEFIQAFARGQVTLREFTEQMTATIGKFAGWAVAGAAVYGVFRLFKDLKDGATETQAAVQQLSRFIPGLGGPAGGGTGQISAAETTVRNISTQFNVPISEVTSAMGVTARVFHNLADAGEAARGVLAAARLDQVPIEEGTRYAIGISQSFGFTRGGQFTQVINSLNALQSQYGARVAETLPGLARVAPTAMVSNVSPQMAEALVSMGVLGGFTGPTIGTALRQSMATFAFRPSSIQSYAAFGALSGHQINPVLGDYGGLITQIMSAIGEGTREGRPIPPSQLRMLATALGGPRQGAGYLLPLLERQARDPGALQQFVTQAEHPRDYQKDLARVLDTVSERFKQIGISLQAFGSMLAQAGALQPLIYLLDAFRFAANTVRTLFSPFADALGLFNRLPTVLQDVLGALVGFAAVRGIWRSRFGETAQAFLGRLPGTADYQESPRSAVRGQLGNIESYILPEERAQAEQSARNLFLARGRLVRAQQEQLAYQGANANLGSGGIAFDPRSAPGQEYEKGSAERQAAIRSAESRIAGAQQEASAAALAYAQRQADVTVLKDRQYSDEQKATLLQQRGYVADGQYADLKEQQVALLHRQMELMGAGGATVGAGGLGGAAAVGGSAAVIAAANAVANDPSTMQNIVQQGEQARGQVILPSGVERPSAPQESTAYATASAVQQRLAREAEAQRGLLNQLGLSGVVSGAQSRLASLRGGIAEAGGVGPYALGRAQQFGSALSGPAGPFAGLIAAQLVGGAVPGGPGQYISGVGGAAFSGALIAQMLGRSSGIGFAAGGALGALQQGGAAGGIGALLGGLAGGALGALSFTPFGVGIGAAAGSAVGGIVGNLFGHHPSPQDQAQASQRDAARALSSGTQNFSSDFSAQLAQAFGGSGSAAASAQNKISQIMQDLTAQLAIFGTASKRGQTAQQELQTTIEAATTTFNTNPAAAQQIIQAASTVISGVVTRTSALIKYGDPSKAASELAAARGQINSMGSATQAALAQAEQELRTQENFLSTEHTEHGRQAVRTLMDQTTKSIENYKAVLQYLKLAEQDAVDQLSEAAVQQQQQLGAAHLQTLQARTGDPTRRTGEAVQQDIRNIGSVYRLTTPGSQARTRTLGPASAQLQQDVQAYEQSQIDRRQALGQVATNEIPTVDAIARANQEYTNQVGILDFMKQHSRVFGATAIAQQAAQVAQAWQGIADATYQTNSDLISAEASLAQAQAHGDAALTAAAQLQQGQRMLGIARTPAQRISAQAQIVSAGTAAQEATRQNADLQSQITQAADYGNSVAQANDAIAGANRQLSLAQNTQERLQGQKALLDAHNQLSQAIADRFIAEGELWASQTVDPTQQAYRQLQGTLNALRATPANQVDRRRQLQTQANNLTHQWEQATEQQRAETIDFQFQMMQISGGAAVRQLQDLLKLRGLSRQTRQQLLEQIRRFQLGQESPIGASGFDLAPGNIRLPTFYDVGHAVQAARLRQPTQHNVDARTEINVYVRRGEDVPKVYDALGRATGAGLRARLKAAGVR